MNRHEQEATMARPKHSKTVERSRPDRADVAPMTPASTEMLLVPSPKLRKMIGISAVTLWRWRRDDAAFPTAKSINGRLYFPWAEVQAWLARQQQAA